jgi:hypothetical protein
VPRAKAASQPPSSPNSRPTRRELPKPFDEKTRAVNDAELLAALRGAPGPGRVAPELDDPDGGVFDAPTRLGDASHLFDEEDSLTRPAEDLGAKFIPATTVPSAPEHLDDLQVDEDATRLASVDSVAPRPRRGQPPREERTRSVDIRDDRAISDVDWDID